MASAALMSDDKPTTVDKMPQKAQTFIKSYFGKSKVAYAKRDTELFDGSYTVVFTDGSKVEFTSKGEWKDIECATGSVPQALIPTQIKAYVKANHPAAHITELERDRRGWDVKLSTRISLEFDLKYRLTDIDR